MRRLTPLTLLLALSLLLPLTLVIADPPRTDPAIFSWTTAKVQPTIKLGEATAVAAKYLRQPTAPDQTEFVQITNRQYRGNTSNIVFYGWRLHYAGLVSKHAKQGQAGVTLLINGVPAVYNGDSTALLWPPASVAADIPDLAPRTP